jgi:glycosyltransferase involved in cell wall biosynthesis
MADAARFSIVTTCKGRRQHIRRTLPALAATPMSEVIVVDCDCPDVVGEWVRRNHRGVSVVRVAPRPGFNLSEARNQRGPSRRRPG